MATALALVTLAPQSLLAQVASAPSPSTAPVGSGAGASVYGTCLEHVPEGATRPVLVERFPDRGLVGYALPLEITVRHGQGESVLPRGASSERDASALDSLTRSGFELPSPDTTAATSTVPQPAADKSGSVVTITVIALPKTPGRSVLTLPPLPVAVARASGEVITVCTQPHGITLEQPTANTPDAKPNLNPPPRRQREEWIAAKRVALTLPVVLLSALLGAFLYRWWRQRPRPVPPPPPPRPPWEIALRELALLRTSPQLADEAKAGDYLSAVSAVLRHYLGQRYGFDGLEATSQEIRRALRPATPPLPALAEVERFLDETDLVKFARVVPSRNDCLALREVAERIVYATMPASSPPLPAPVAAVSEPRP